ncbi:MAG TPA: SDR family oxidoreductase [Hyphomicrobium sp.]|nr:SDR family oxidoreductase [Hyphomicrobium sp.]
MAFKKALVVGASGVIGHGIIRHLENLAGWGVVGMSRGPAPRSMADVPWITADINDARALESHRHMLADVTHVFYAAYVPSADLAREAEVNAGMLRGLLDGLQTCRSPLQRVVLFQGGKVYGLHLGPVKTPMRESDPRHMPPNFYYDLEDLLAERSSSSNWTYTLLRPDIVLGAIPGQPLNLAMVIGAYAAFCQALRVPFRFPGSPAGYRVLMQATDTDLLARVSVWAAEASIAAGQAYNVTNGDLFRWENLWPALADHLGLDVGPPMSIRLVDHMKDKGALWAEFARRFGLVTPDYRQAVGWAFGDWVFHTGFDVVSDLTKLRLHGCRELRSTDEVLVEKLGQLQARRLIPPLHDLA